jgi:GT2 family glycosyltransferase
VSIIVPVHGKFATTWTCLDSLSRVPAGASFEVIVADDCSPDRTPEMLARVRGIRVERNAKNLGFALTNNVAAKLARGKWLCLLNNDTRVRPGWLGELVHTFDAFPDAGIVGARLLFPDGRLQEAGAMVFRDGIASQYGRKRDPRRPEFSCVRRVDYCSAAGVLIKKSLWDQLGGFDEHFAPAYYEDTDLAFRVRRAGLQVLYQPRSCIVHYEGISHGRSLRRGPKAHQVVNHRRFVERWREVLEKDHFVAHRRNWQTADGRRAVGLLVLCDVEPSSGSECFDTVLAADAAGWRVTLWALGASRDGGATRASLQQRGIEVLYPPYTTSLRVTLRAAPPGRFRAALLWNRPDVDEVRARLAVWAKDLLIVEPSLFTPGSSGGAIEHADRVRTWRELIAKAAGLPHQPGG